MSTKCPRKPGEEVGILKLQSWVVISYLVRMLGLQLRSSGRAVCAHEHTHKTRTPHKTQAWRSETILGIRFFPSTVWVPGVLRLGGKNHLTSPCFVFLKECSCSQTGLKLLILLPQSPNTEKTAMYHHAQHELSYFIADYSC